MASSAVPQSARSSMRRFAGDVLAWRDEIAKTRPREADNRVVVFGRVLSWAKKRNKIQVNILEGYQRLYRADRSEKIWLPDHIGELQKAAPPELWAVILVGLHTGLRQGDLRRLAWSAYDGTAITRRITKRRKGSAGVSVTIPCTKALKALLDGLPRRGPRSSPQPPAKLGRSAIWPIDSRKPGPLPRSLFRRSVPYTFTTCEERRSRSSPRPALRCRRSPRSPVTATAA